MLCINYLACLEGYLYYETSYSKGEGPYFKKFKLFLSELPILAPLTLYN